MRPEERNSLLREGVARAATPRERVEAVTLAEDVRSLGGKHGELRPRLRNFTQDPDTYLAALGGPLHYMVRLREIQERTDALLEELAERYDALRERARDDFASRWREEVSGMRFDELNDLISRHNRWYPVESRLRMDPRRGDYALVNGRDYRLPPLDADWVIARFPAGPES
ncbi:MAG: hypothetical protein U0R50_17470 [Gaiellales bacterium]